MDWLQDTSGRELLVLGGGTLTAFFGWDFFRLLRLAAGAFAGALVGWGVYNLAGLPAPLAAREIDPRLWLLLLVLFFGLAGYFLLRLIKTLGVFLIGAALGLFCGKAVMALLFPSRFPMVWLSPSPSEALLAAIAGGGGRTGEREDGRHTHDLLHRQLPRRIGSPLAGGDMGAFRRLRSSAVVDPGGPSGSRRREGKGLTKSVARGSGAGEIAYPS